MVQKREGDNYTTKILEQTEKDEHEQKGVKQQTVDMSKDSSSIVTEKRYIMGINPEGGRWENYVEMQKFAFDYFSQKYNDQLRAMRRQGVFEEKGENATEASENE